jgi:hypothetical protein
LSPNLTGIKSLKVLKNMGQLPIGLGAAPQPDIKITLELLHPNKRTRSISYKYLMESHR